MKGSRYSDEELEERLREVDLSTREGMDEAYQVMYDQFYDTMYVFFLRRTGSKQDAEVLVQNTFLRIHKHIHRVDLDQNVVSWVTRIGKNLLKNYYRNNQRNPIRYFSEIMAPNENGDRDEGTDYGTMNMASDSNPALDAERSGIEEIVDSEMDQSLSEAHAKTLRLRLEGRSYEEIAAETGVKIGTVKSRIHRARQQLAKSLRENEGFQEYEEGVEIIDNYLGEEAA